MYQGANREPLLIFDDSESLKLKRQTTNISYSEYKKLDQESLKLLLVEAILIILFGTSLLLSKDEIEDCNLSPRGFVYNYTVYYLSISLTIGIICIIASKKNLVNQEVAQYVQTALQHLTVGCFVWPQIMVNYINDSNFHSLSSIDLFDMLLMQIENSRKNSRNLNQTNFQIYRIKLYQTSKMLDLSNKI
ncbi:UNKNOWN [Stylonychia lemnae]|uniref:Transmembrane protein n=1 Tax=Stylonychia lemnae TaxID=5949 RepID=A0A078AY12_STYLE|nr:UNKNOWN [Stylonychia lemnae]|eukprot:CDW87320.1 UNKNOWN [Stylonychia lemnae]